METKRIPFDLARINEDNVKVVTRDGRSVRILCTDAKVIRKPIIGLIKHQIQDSEGIAKWTTDGRYYADVEGGGEYGADLFLEIPVKQRRMTYKKLAWWLREHPEEHREVRCGNWDGSTIAGHFNYTADLEHSEVPNGIYIRSNGGEWHEPLINEE